MQSSPILPVASGSAYQPFTSQRSQRSQISTSTMPTSATRLKVRSGTAPLPVSMPDDVYSLKRTITRSLDRTMPTKAVGEAKKATWPQESLVPERADSNASLFCQNNYTKEAALDQVVFSTPTSTGAASRVGHEPLRFPGSITSPSACYDGSQLDPSGHNDLQSLLYELEKEKEALGINRGETSKMQQEAMESLEVAEREIGMARVAKGDLEVVIKKRYGREVLLDLLELCGERAEIEEKSEEEDEEKDTDESFKEQVESKTAYAVPYEKQKPSAVREGACYTDTAPVSDTDVSSLHLRSGNQAGGSAIGRDENAPLPATSVLSSGKGKRKREADERGVRGEPQRKKAKIDQRPLLTARPERILTANTAINRLRAHRPRRPRRKVRNPLR